MKYIVRNNKTGRSYETESATFKTTLDEVWFTQKDWFSSNCSVTITDENGNSKTFTKEQDIRSGNNNV